MPVSLRPPPAPHPRADPDPPGGPRRSPRPDPAFRVTAPARAARAGRAIRHAPLRHISRGVYRRLDARLTVRGTLEASPAIPWTTDSVRVQNVIHVTISGGTRLVNSDLPAAFCSIRKYRIAVDWYPLLGRVTTYAHRSAERESAIGGDITRTTGYRGGFHLWRCQADRKANASLGHHILPTGRRGRAARNGASSRDSA